MRKRTKAQKAQTVVGVLYNMRRWPGPQDDRVRCRARLPIDVLDDQYARALAVLGPNPGLLPGDEGPIG